MVRLTSFQPYLRRLNSILINVRDEWKHRFGKRAYSDIDSRIAPLIKAMNDTGVIFTFASCQGHALTPSTPYVAFQTTPQIAALIELTLRKDAINKAGTLNRRWSIVGAFSETGDLVFCLSAPQFDKNVGTIRNWLALGILRVSLDKDLLCLREIICQAIQTHLGNEVKRNHE
jgi:hypothetical protein